jgi:hypothetical protein
MSIVVDPSAREMFTPRELADAYEDFRKLGPHHVDAETGTKAAAYRFDERVLLVYEESESGLVVLIHPSAWKVNSRKFAWYRAPKTHDVPVEGRGRRGSGGLGACLRPKGATRFCPFMLRVGLSQWRNRLPRVSRERLARV